jgi:hypothetical protein
LQVKEFSEKLDGQGSAGRSSSDGTGSDGSESDGSDGSGSKRRSPGDANVSNSHSERRQGSKHHE